MIHCWAARPASRSRPIVGSAMLTTVPSMKVIDEPMMVAIRIQRRRPSSAATAGVATSVTSVSPYAYGRDVRADRRTLSVPLRGVPLPLRRGGHDVRPRRGDGAAALVARGGPGRRRGARDLPGLRRAARLRRDRGGAVRPDRRAPPRRCRRQRGHRVRRERRPPRRRQDLRDARPRRAGREAAGGSRRPRSSRPARARRFDAGKGRPMREWASVPPDAGADWDALADEACSFVRG